MTDSGVFARIPDPPPLGALPRARTVSPDTVVGMAGRVGKTLWGVFSTLIVLALIAAAGFAYLQRQNISDHFAAQSFEPSQEMSELTDRLMLTDTGRRVFFATHPTLEASQLFNEQCADVDHSEDGHILGCYTRDSIHLFKVTDERLNGIVEVTAAHELLHAAWARLGDGERSELVASLTRLYEELAEEDHELADRMSVYSELSEDAFANELHSVLGTEVRELPDWLEAHYARWFEDRLLIIDFFDAYHEVFAQIQARADELQSQLTALRESIEARSDDYDAALTQFNADVDDFNRRNAAYEFSGNVDEYWRLRGELEARSSTLSAERESIQADIDRYEQMRQELAELSDKNAELNQQLDSNLAPPPTPDGV